MVRAGAVRHPRDRVHSGYREIQQPPRRYRLIDISALSTLCGFDNIAAFQRAHRAWVEAALVHESGRREPYWTEAIAVGGGRFVARV
jgi:putative transposase